MPRREAPSRPSGWPGSRSWRALQARVFGVLEAAMAALTGIGFFAGGALAALGSPRMVYVAAGVGGLAVLLVTTLRLRGGVTESLPAASP